ncbi:Phytanoyl-CoA dioxygenase (PhyH) [Gimesia panareensis]|uniref:Ectoine hydroxylase n=1 Tax=Gimesia panareensis TaxID=2527978 RepID=A0A517QC54_9PLAN|nr:ectoine hydroxylase [Gimesia panareensis]QDT29204.1 Phytanoyl-CoA dioxygenase (PhyH) [Gimesia panareensis]
MNTELANSNDLYPSRVKPQPEFLDRTDPVVYGSPQAGPLTAGQLNQFERDGFLILPAFFSEQEIAACNAELARLRDSDSTRKCPEAIVEPDCDELRSLFAIHQPDISPFFAEVARDARIASMAMQILGSEVYIHQSRVNLKPGFAGREFYWHSDFETWHVEDGMPRMRAVSCSLLLTDNYEFNAPLMLVPGSHQKYVSCVGETPEDHYLTSLQKQELGIPDQDSLHELVNQHGIIQGEGPAGTLVLFDCNTMHGSNGNITPFPRSNLFFVYNSIWNQLTEPFGQKAPRPEFIASRLHCAPVSQRAVDYSLQ